MQKSANFAFLPRIISFASARKCGCPHSTRFLIFRASNSVVCARVHIKKPLKLAPLKQKKNKNPQAEKYGWGGNLLIRKLFLFGLIVFHVIEIQLINRLAEFGGNLEFIQTLFHELLHVQRFADHH